MKILVDAHVHIYNCFKMEVFFNSAIDNFKKEAINMGCEYDYRAVVMLTDWKGQDWFTYLVGLIDNPSSTPRYMKNWSFHHTEETISIYGRRTNEQGIFVVAGRKIITAENLEVLALATDKVFQDGTPLGELIFSIKQCGAIPVIPWAVGKWMGRRGKIIRELLEKKSDAEFFICDNGNRPIFWPRPLHFKLAEERGIRVLAGSDPLHFASEAKNVGGFAFSVEGTMSHETPARDLTRVLKDPTNDIRAYGQLEKPFRFFRNQVAMQMLKRRHKRDY